MRIRTYDEIIKSKEDVIFIDLRTKGEFDRETIPNAYNVPIFSDEQRAVIGTIYKQESPKSATEQAVKFISERLPQIFDQINELDKQRKTLVFFCARGGMRSSSIVGLLTGLKYNCCKLDFGYKGYRAYINEKLPKELQKVNFITLYGKTGTGKTNVLNQIKKLGFDVLDLEKCANHRGSLLGQVGLSEQNTQKQFESLIFEMLINRKTDTIFTEGESRRIGKIVMQDFIYQKIVNSKKVLIDASIEYRINVIKNDYIGERFDKQEVIDTLSNKLSKYISKSKIEELINLMIDEQYDKVIEDLMVNYYDLNYKCAESTFTDVFYNSGDILLAKELIKKYSHIIV